MDWQPIETAPKDVRGLVWIEDKVLRGVAFGRVITYGNSGERFAVADGFNGDWNISHWMPLPEPPQSDA